MYGRMLICTLALLASPVELLRADESPPRVLHFCWTNCFTLTLQDGRYVRADGSDETWTIERFTPTSVLLHRHDAATSWNGFSNDVAYQGEISNDQLMNVTVAGHPVPDVRMAWGTALDSLPGSNAERDQRSAAQPPSAPAPAPADAELVGDASSTEAPPPLENEEQPPCPADGYLWTPGYWAWGGGVYYWVRGVWAQPPRLGLLWTPGYWTYVGAVYVLRPGYWGPHVGYYGGINYGFGYRGTGFAGGRWMGNVFAYNTAVSHVNVNIARNTYTETGVNNVGVSKVSYNGGPGGTVAVPTAAEKAAAAEPHVAATPLQRQYVQQAAAHAATIAPSSRLTVVRSPATPIPSTASTVSPAVHGSSAVPAQRASATQHATIARSAPPKLASTSPIPAARPQDAATPSPAPKPSSAPKKVAEHSKP